METLSERQRKSRGKVKCDLCLNTIPKGVVYEISTYVDAGDIWSFKLCPECQQLAAVHGRLYDPYGEWGLDCYSADAMCLEYLEHGVDPEITVHDARIMHDYLVRRRMEGYV